MKKNCPNAIIIGLVLNMITVVVTVTYGLNNGLFTKDKYPGSKSQLFVLEKVTATFKCTGYGLTPLLLTCSVVCHCSYIVYHK